MFIAALLLAAAPSLHERIKTAERAMLVDAVGRIARDGIKVDGRRVRIGAEPR